MDGKGAHPYLSSSIVPFPGNKILLIGPGFIGWPILDLLVDGNYEVTVFVRRESHGQQLARSGAARIAVGNLDDTDLIRRWALHHDIIIHTATSDHLPSVEAVLAAIQERADKGYKTIFIHTSGTCILDDQAMGNFKSEKVYRDDDVAEIDSLPINAPHRNVDIPIVKFQRQLGEKAKIAIMIPSCVCGFNKNHGRLSIQIPTLTRYALKHGYAGQIGAGLPVQSYIHVNDLARGYLALLHHLERTSPNSPQLLENPYYFCESTGKSEPSWNEIATLIGQELHARGLISDPKPRTIPPENYDDILKGFTNAAVGLNSRSRAVRLRELGWKPIEKNWEFSFRFEELPAILSEDVDRKAFNGYQGIIP
ncbi:NAD(P)-binding protein [Hypomontagnella monticulosa]|nr:NAD(P)-binding protein [Hypomontagnella monticulosa]